jgi:hypothetical protein
MVSILAGKNAPESTDVRIVDTALAVFIDWPTNPKHDIIPHIALNAYDPKSEWVVSHLSPPGVAFCPPGHFTPFHIDIACGHNLHVIASGWKLWIFIPHGESSFQSQHWGFDSDCPLTSACTNASQVQLVVTAPGSVLVTPPNIIHAVITLGLTDVTPLAIHNSIETNHQPSIVNEVKKAIPIYLDILSRKEAHGRLAFGLDTEMMAVLDEGQTRGMHPSDYKRLANSLTEALRAREIESD